MEEKGKGQARERGVVRRLRSHYAAASTIGYMLAGMMRLAVESEDFHMFVCMRKSADKINASVPSYPIHPAVSISFDA